MNQSHPIIAREGWPFVAAAIAAALIAWLLAGPWWSVPLWLAAIFVVQFFRDPPRHAPQIPNAVFSPADGRVVEVGKARDPYLGRDCLKLSVFMNVFDVHSNRSPVGGRILDAWYREGSFFNAALAKSSQENERKALHIRTGAGADIVCVQIAGLVARRILCYVKPGEELAPGQRYGFIRFGSRVDLYLPCDARARASLGQRVYAGTSIVAELRD